MFWMNLQANWDLWHAHEEERKLRQRFHEQANQPRELVREDLASHD
jgi:plasmid maintenance system antidote protein VapI